MAKKVTGFRFSDETLQQLEYLCKFSGETRTDTLAMMIASEYDKLQGNPVLTEMMSQMKNLTEQMKSYLGQSKEQ